MQHLEHFDELGAQAVLERHAPGVDPPRHEYDFLVLDVDALHRPDAFGEVEHLGFAERLGREPAALAVEDHGRVEAFLDRRPNRKCGRERPPSARRRSGWTRRAPHLVDAREQVVGGVAGKDVGKPGLNTHSDEGQLAALAPLRVEGELLVAELDAGATRTASRGAASTATSPCRGSARRRRGPRGTPA